MADAGRAVAFRLAPGQAHELPHTTPLLDDLSSVPKWVVADRGYTGHAFRQHIWDMGARPAIPPLRPKRPSPALTGFTTIAIGSNACGPG